MKNSKTFISITVIIVLYFNIYTLLADYKIDGNLSSVNISRAGNNNFYMAGRIGASISGNTRNSIIGINSGFNKFKRAAIAGMNNENPSLTELNVDKENIKNNPIEFRLFENYPNPFNPTTTIRFNIPMTTNVSIKVYDIRGQEITTLVNQRYFEVGSYTVNFDASNLSSGIYLYRIIAGSYQSVKKMMLLK